MPVGRRIRGLDDHGRRAWAFQRTLHLVNKQNDLSGFDITAKGDGVTFTIPVPHAELGPFETRTIPVVATVPRALTSRPIPITIEVRATDGTVKHITAVVLGPGGTS